LARAPSCHLASMLTCCATPAATPWPMPATTRGWSRTGSAIKQSSTPRAIRS